MKLRKMVLLIFGTVFMFSFSSCNDNDRRAENEQMRNDSIQLAEENRLEQERMELESTSVFAMVQGDTVLTTFSRNLETNEMSDTFRQEEGPFTVFAPSNVAYQNLSQEERDNLMNAQNTEENSARMFFLVIEEELTPEELRNEIEEADGTYTLTTMQGEDITATMEGEEVILRDASGNEASLTNNSIDASNGIVHIIDAVLMPSDASTNAALDGGMNGGMQQDNAADTTATNNQGM